jgi:hypothetical protein
MRVRVSMLLKSRASPDMLPFSLCNKKRLTIRHMNRPSFPTTQSIPSYDIGKEVGLRTYHLVAVLEYTCILTERNINVGKIEHGTLEPRFTNAPVHEQLGSRTSFPSKKVSDDERCLGLRTRKLATAVGYKLRVSARECQLLVNLGSGHIPA